MHEFSIAVSIVDIAVEHAQKAGAKVVNDVELEIGELSGVIYEAMETAMESAIKGTMLEGAEVKIIRTPGRAKCTECGQAFHLENMFDPCPECGAFAPTVISGKELRIKSINVD